MPCGNCIAGSYSAACELSDLLVVVDSTRIHYSHPVGIPSEGHIPIPVLSRKCTVLLSNCTFSACAQAVL